MSSMSLSSNQKNELLFVGFNQDYGCFACGTDNGFRIYNVDPFRETFRRVFSNGGIGIVEMLFRCNLLALVGGGRNPRYPPNKVMIWDDHQSRCIGELSFRSEVKAVRLRRDRVVVVLAQRIYVYRFSDLHLLDRINTIRNDTGLVALCPDASNMVLACPGVSLGHVNVELYDLRRSTLIPAHESELAQLALSMDGKMVATASTRGTLLRVFDTDTGSLLHELRRGMDRADITSICFNQQSTFVACCSDRGTVHVFSLEPGTANGTGTAGGGARAGGGGGAGAHEESPRFSGRRTSGATMNAMSGLRFIGGLMPGLPAYFNSEWSYAQIRGIESRSICAFGREPRTIVLISEDGSFLTARFNEPGECERISYARFLRGTGGSDDEGDDDEIGGANGRGGGVGEAGTGATGGAGAGSPMGALGQPSSAQTPTTLSRRPSESSRQPPQQQRAPPAQGYSATAPAAIPVPSVRAASVDTLYGGNDRSGNANTSAVSASAAPSPTDQPIPEHEAISSPLPPAPLQTSPPAAPAYPRQPQTAVKSSPSIGRESSSIGGDAVANRADPGDGAGEVGGLVANEDVLETEVQGPLVAEPPFMDLAPVTQATATPDELDDLAEGVSRTTL